MINPVSSGILGKGKAMDHIFIDVVIELEEDTEASVCKNGVCGFEENVITGKRFFCLPEPLRCQILFDGEVGELNNLGAGDMDD